MYKKITVLVSLVYMLTCCFFSNRMLTDPIPILITLVANDENSSTNLSNEISIRLKRALESLSNEIEITNIAEFNNISRFGRYIC